MGTISKRSNQTTKFQEGVDGNIRDAFLNSESDLVFDGVDQVLSSKNTLGSVFDFGTSDFTIGCWVEQKSAMGVNCFMSIHISGTITFQLRGETSAGRLQVICNPSNRTIVGGSTHRFSGYPANTTNRKFFAVFVKTGTDINCWVNGVKLTIFSVTNPLQVSDEFNMGSGTLNYGAVESTASAPTNVSLSDGFVLSRAITEDEIEYVHSYKSLPESVHDVCIAHHSLVERYAYDDGVDNLFFDVVEQYNYKKVTPLTANHLKAINFTDAELGVSDTTLMNVKKEFYSKGRLNWGSSKLEGVSGLDQSISFPDIAIEDIDGSTFFVLELRSKIESSSDIRLHQSRSNLTINNDRYLFAVNIFNNQLRVLSAVNAIATKGSIVDIPIPIVDDTLIRVVVAYDHPNKETRISAKIGSRRYKTTVTHSDTFLVGQDVFDPQIGKDTGFGTTKDMAVIDYKVAFTKPTDQEIEDVLNKTDSYTWALDAAFNTSVDAVIQDLSGNNYDGTIVNGNTWVEANSLLPIIKESLLHETGISIGAAYTSIVGMGFTIQLQTDIAALSEIITGLPTITGFYVNGVSAANEAAVVSALNLNQLIHIDLEWSSASPTITFVHSGEDYYLIRDYYLDEVLEFNDKQHLVNNLLFSNPYLQLQTKFNYYSLHNEGNYIEGATNPENVPLIDVDTIGNRESLGWTGATAADKLADLITNITLINSLR